jgi:hypothetical protein
VPASICIAGEVGIIGVRAGRATVVEAAADPWVEAGRAAEVP